MMKNKGANSPVMLVSFSGIDGAGKSTQIASLSAALQEAGVPVHLVTFWDDVATMKSLREGAGHKVFKGDKGVGSPDAPIERRDKNVRSPMMTFVRMAMYFFDALALRRKAREVSRSTSGVVIFDRYLYDELANLNLQNPFMKAYARLLAKLVPQPSVALVIDADPVLARARKPEYPLEFLHSNRNSYLNLSRILGGITVIEPASIPQMKAAVAESVRTAGPASLKYLGTESAHT